MNSLDEAAYVQYLKKWLSGIRIEVAWWKEWLETRGGEWSDDYLRRTGPEPDFTLSDLVLDRNGSPLQVLDVGAGPISPLGLRCPRGAVHLQACDALAPFYRDLLRQSGVEPYVWTEFALLERLTDRFRRDSFDLVHMRNALDHCFNPLLGLYQMLDVTRTGGTIYLHHFENEGSRTGYIALHQWNMTERQGDFVIWNPHHEWNINQMFVDSLDVTVSRDASGHPNCITAVIKKRRNVESPERPAQLGIYDALLLYETARAYGTDAPEGGFGCV